MSKLPEWDDISETGNWNVAAGYVQLLNSMIYEAKEYYDLAKFGSSHLIEDFTMDENTRNKIKLMAIKRFNATILHIIDHVRFLVRSDAKADIPSCENILFEADKVIPILEEKRLVNGRPKNIGINEEAFEKVLFTINKVRIKIYEHMNRADLIFSASDYIDPVKFKALIKERLMTHG